MTANRWLIGGAALLIAFGVLPASAQNANDLQTRINRLERDIRDLQAATFRRPPGSLPDADLPADAGGAQPAPDLGPMLRRMDELEETLGRLTGQMEELGHQVEQLTQKSDRLQKQMDLQANGQAQLPAVAAAPLDAPTTGSQPPAPQDPPGAVASLAPSDNGPTLRPFAPPPPQPGTLGQIPANSGLPIPPPPPADPKREYDAAQGLLNRAQYDRAETAFRAFVDAHPASDLAPHALYRTGDIAYSIKKDYDTAAHDFVELLKSYPKAPDAPDSMLKLGLSLISLGQVKEGCAALAALPAKYPDASPATVARARNERRDNKCR